LSELFACVSLRDAKVGTNTQSNSNREWEAVRLEAGLEDLTTELEGGCISNTEAIEVIDA